MLKKLKRNGMLFTVKAKSGDLYNKAKQHRALRALGPRYARPLLAALYALFD